MAPFLILYLPTHSPKPNESIGSKLRKMDWLGIVLIASVYVTYTLSLTFGGAQWAWDNYRFILMIIVFGVTLLIFIITQYFAILTTKERRVFPGQFLRSRSLILIFIATSAQMCTLFLGAYYVSYFVPRGLRCWPNSDVSADSVVLPVCSIRLRYYGGRPLVPFYLCYAHLPS